MMLSIELQSGSYSERNTNVNDYTVNPCHHNKQVEKVKPKKVVLLFDPAPQSCVTKRICWKAKHMLQIDAKAAIAIARMHM
jgi:hypothetical protein